MASFEKYYTGMHGQQNIKKTYIMFLSFLTCNISSIFLLRVMYRKNILITLYVGIFSLHFLYWISRCPPAGQIFPKLPARNKWLNKTVLRLCTVLSAQTILGTDRMTTYNPNEIFSLLTPVIKNYSNEIALLLERACDCVHMLIF